MTTPTPVSRKPPPPLEDVPRSQPISAGGHSESAPSQTEPPHPHLVGLSGTENEEKGKESEGGVVGAGESSDKDAQGDEDGGGNDARASEGAWELYGEEEEEGYEYGEEILPLERRIKGLAEYIKSPMCKNVVLVIGAGASTAAGIPDFRSPGTGLYDNLQRLNLPHPEAVFDLGFFQENPVPFYTLAHELYPGKFRPTLTHSFMRLLHERNLLMRLFTQNIDTLERRAGVPPEKIVEAHGSFATQRCINCNKPYDDDKMREAILKQEIARCGYCNGLVKPDIVFFGESLPDTFFSEMMKVPMADLVIVIGTSLVVGPFNILPEITENTRCLINMTHAGTFGTRHDDIILLGKCDDIIVDLAKALGWYEDLVRLWEETAESVDEAPEEKVDASQTALPTIISTPVTAAGVPVGGRSVGEDEVDDLAEELLKKAGIKDTK